MTVLEEGAPAPELEVSQWFNVDAPLSLTALRGKVVLLHAFQMLCPGCVLHGTPQAQRVDATFAQSQLQVIGLHTVFEHHEAMQAVSLKAFIHEYRLRFPVGIDAPADGQPVPKTMRAYGMRGTPTSILIDKRGIIRMHEFGQLDDLALGARIGTLLAEAV